MVQGTWVTQQHCVESYSCTASPESPQKSKGLTHLTGRVSIPTVQRSFREILFLLDTGSSSQATNLALCLSNHSHTHWAEGLPLFTRVGSDAQHAQDMSPEHWDMNRTVSTNGFSSVSIHMHRTKPCPHFTAVHRKQDKAFRYISDDL